MKEVEDCVNNYEGTVVVKISYNLKFLNIFMKIYVAQVKPLVGNLIFNFKLIEKYYEYSVQEKCDVCILPELVTTGYIPKDLLLKSIFLEEIAIYTKSLIDNIQETVLLLPTPSITSNGLENSVLAIQNSKIIGKTSKKHLVNYGIFDENRYFKSGTPQIININGVNIGVPICEDIWFPDVTKYLKDLGAEIFIVPNGSPFESKKYNNRLNVVIQRFNETNIPIIYCNQVLGQDGIVYDGRSFGYDGQLKFQLKPFIEDSVIVTLNKEIFCTSNSITEYPAEDLVYGAMVSGLYDYVTNNNFDYVLLGLSGGIDSALVAAIAVDSLGADKVFTLMLKSQFTSKESLEDAKETAKLLGTKYQIIDIDPIVNMVTNTILNISSLAYENLQARVRGLILMTLSNSLKSLVLTTGNKSEVATGYSTLYGDMCGAFNPIKDLYKTEVFNISKFRNNNIPTSVRVKNYASPVMADRILIKNPSAELKHNQKDSDSLPEYDLLDKILELYIEKDLGIKEIVSLGYDTQIVKKITQLIKVSEYKRNQSSPGVKLTQKDLQLDRRYPITNSYY